MKRKKSFSFIYKYIVFFLGVSFVTSCTTILFLTHLQKNLGFEFTEPMISRAATLSFYNVFFLSFLITLVDAMNHYFRVYRPVKMILAFTDKLSSGSFGEQLEYSRHINNEFAMIIDNLNLLSRELASIEAMRTEAISNISHELKTPLSVIHNYARLLCYDDLEKEKCIEYSEAIYKQTGKASSLIQNILKMSRLEKQEIYKKNERFSLSDELAECIIAFEDKIEKKEISLDVDIPDDIMISSDRELMDIVWNNLISNAVKFSNEKGTISIKIKDNDGIYSVCVSNSGPGISKEDIPHIFEKYYQGAGEHKREGNGLGLAMVKRIIEILGYSISVESSPEDGTSFLVVLED